MLGGYLERRENIYGLTYSMKYNILFSIRIQLTSGLCVVFLILRRNSANQISNVALRSKNIFFERRIIRALTVVIHVYLRVW